MANCEHNINLNNPFRVNIELRYGNTVDGIRLVFFTDEQETPMDFTGWTFSTDFFDIEVELPNVLILSKSAEGMQVTLRDYNLDIKGTLNGVEKTIVAGKYEVKKDYLTSGCVQDGSTINLQYFNVIERIIDGGAGIKDVIAGANVSINKTDPERPIINATGEMTSGVASVTGEFVNNTDPLNPKIEGITAALGDKVDKSGTKQLSDENFELAEKNKLEGLENYDDAPIRLLIAEKADEDILSEVAKTGDYNDLSNKPDLSAFDNVETVENFIDLPLTGASDVFYIVSSTGIVYRWSGLAYVQLSGGLALGETAETAYRGDRGKQAFDLKHEHSNKSLLDTITAAFTTALKTAYDNAVTWISTNGTNLINHLSATNNPHGVTKTQVGLGNADNTSDVDKPISTATKNYVDAGVLDQNTGTGVGNIKFWTGTQSEYDAISSKDSATLYFIK